MGRPLVDFSLSYRYNETALGQTECTSTELGARSDSMSDETIDKSRPITMSEAAKLYGFNHSYLTELARKGRLKATKSGGTWLTTVAHVEEYLASRRKRGAYREDIQPLDNT
jgi:excisionase family DNA binding protein